MKRILVIIIILIMLPFNVNAKEKVTRQKVSNIYSNRVVNGSTYKSQAYIIKSLDKYLYYTKATYLGIDDLYHTSNDKEIINEIVSDELINIYGYYGGERALIDEYYYLAAQELIWRKLGVNNVWWSDNNGNVINIDKYKEEILNLTETYLTKPYFEINDLYNIGDVITLYDKNKVLDNYDIVSNDNIVKEENNIIINILENNDFKLEKNNKEDDKIILFYSEGYEPLIYNKQLPSISVSYSIKGIKKEIPILPDKIAETQKQEVDENITKQEEVVLSELPKTSVRKNTWLFPMILLSLFIIIYEKR